MSQPRPPHLVETCLVKDIEATLEAAADYDLLAISTHQVGAGFGSYVQAVLVFRLRAAEPVNGNGNHRRRPMPAVPVKKPT